MLVHVFIPHRPPPSLPILWTGVNSLAMYVWWETLRVGCNFYFRIFSCCAFPSLFKTICFVLFSSPFSLRDESMKESLYALAVFASPGLMIDDDLRRGCGLCKEKDRGNLSSSRKSRSARAAMLILPSLSFICGWRNRVRRLGKTYGTSGLYWVRRVFLDEASRECYWACSICCCQPGYRIVITHWAWQLGFLCSIPGRYKWISSSSKLPGWFWGSPCLLLICCWGKAAGMWSSLLTFIYCRV